MVGIKMIQMLYVNNVIIHVKNVLINPLLVLHVIH